MTKWYLTEKVIVLDIDETLVHSFDDDEIDFPIPDSLRDRFYRIEMVDVVTPRGLGDRSTMIGIKRPHLDEFLRFCFEYFRAVIVWSAGKPRYVEAIVEKIFNGIATPHLVLTYDHVETSSGAIEKPLEKIYSYEPDLREFIHERNTLIIDDRDTAFLFSNSGNGILIPPFDPLPTPEGLGMEDDRLLQLMAWFRRPDVMTATDVRPLRKEDIFQKDFRDSIT